jgi:hypothetical protein
MTGSVLGFGGQDQLDFAGAAFGSSSSLVYSESANHAGGTLTVGYGTHAATLVLIGNYVPSTFAAMSDGHGGMPVSNPPAGSSQQSKHTSQS